MKKILLAMLALSFISANAQEAYEWDDDGVPTFSNTKPTQVSDDDLSIATGSPNELNEPNVKQQIAQTNTMRTENEDNIKEQMQYMREHDLMVESDRLQENNGANGCGGMYGMGMMGGGLYTDSYFDNASRGGTRWCLPTEVRQFGYGGMGMMGGYY